MRAISNWISWQLRSRIQPGSHIVSFVGDTKLQVHRGMHGATGSIYCGLHEFEDMAFVLHFLRPSDLFIDIGANVGTYTVLASGACGARTISVEPVSTSVDALQANIKLNCITERVRLEIAVLGEQAGVVRISNSLDCTNHVLLGDEAVSFERVPMKTLDELTQAEQPDLIKIDVEGFEMSVLKGGQELLASPVLQGIIIEMNGSGQKYGVTDAEITGELHKFGFVPHQYEPMKRSIEPILAPTSRGGNVLFLRNIEFIRERLIRAKCFKTMGEKI